MKIKTVAFVLLGAMTAACASKPRSDPALRERTTLTVDNQSFYDMTVYASRGQRIRLGTAGGKSRTVFTIPRSLVSGVTTLHFIADPIGSSRASVSEEINVSEGDAIQMTISPP